MELEGSEMDEYVSPAQLDDQLVTLSLLPDSRWKNLLHLDIIKVCVSCNIHSLEYFLILFFFFLSQLTTHTFVVIEKEQAKRTP